MFAFVLDVVPCDVFPKRFCHYVADPRVIASLSSSELPRQFFRQTNAEASHEYYSLISGGIRKKYSVCEVVCLAEKKRIVIQAAR